MHSKMSSGQQLFFGHIEVPLTRDSGLQLLLAELLILATERAPSTSWQCFVQTAAKGRAV